MREQARRDAVVDLQEQDAAATEEPATQQRFIGGRVPPVEHGFADQSGASDLVFAEDSNERELKQKVGALCERMFGGDYKKAFEHYDVDGKGAINKAELVVLLADAGVGNGITRGTWASKIIERLDSNGDHAIEWSEFESAFSALA